MKELFLRPFLAGQKLDVVDHQHIDVPIALPEVHHLVIANRVDDLVGELLGRQIGDPEIGSFRHMIADRVQQMRLSKAHPPIDEEGVVRFPRLFSNCHTGGMRELVPGADDKILKNVLGVELNPPPRLGLRDRLGSTQYCSLVLRLGRFLIDQERDGDFSASTSGRDRFSQKRTIVGLQPVAKELIRNTDMGSRIFNPIQVHRSEPGVVHLLRYLALDEVKRLLPDRVDAHNPLEFLYTGLYTPVDNLTALFTIPSKISPERNR